ncbi:MAG: hypothetical protein ACYDCC_12855 [Actinomycetota bacterium]
MRRIIFVLFVIAVLSAMFAGRSDASSNHREQAWIVLDAPLPFANGLGVNPASRSADAFYREVSAGAPTARVTGAHGTVGALGAALRKAGITIDECGREAGLMIDGTPAPICHGPLTADLIVYVDHSASPTSPADLAIASSGGQTPMRIFVPTFYGVIDGSVTHRPGIVTPYDISTMILQFFRVPKPSSFIGLPLLAGSHSVDIAALSRRLVRDSKYQQSLTAWTVIVGLAVGCFLAFILWFVGLRSIARRIVTGAGFASAGYLIGLFIPSPRGDVRAAFVFLFLVVGASIRLRDPKDVLAKTFIAVAIATTLLEIASAIHPQGEPALSFWGNPLISWRFYGLLNYEAAFIAGGVLVAAMYLTKQPWVLAAVVSGALVITGAPLLGANFVGVLTLGFAGAFAVIASLRKQLNLRYVVIAALIGITLFALALVAGSGVGGSHGARAANEISSGGTHALFSLIWSRLRLNIEAIRAFPGGSLYAVLFVIQFINMIRWSFRNESESLGLRIAIASCSLAGLATLVLEDSGFKMSAVQGFPALILWTLCVMRQPGALEASLS